MEKNDAELLAEQAATRARRMQVVMDAIDKAEPYGPEYTAALVAETQAQCASDARGFEYLSGTRPDEVAALRDRVAELEAAANWALGVDGSDFPGPQVKGAYNWRGLFAEKAGLVYNGQRYVSATPAPDTQEGGA